MSKKICGFWNLFKSELVATIKLYIDVIWHPSHLFVGVYHVVKDIIYELPKSFFQKKEETESLSKKLHKNASQALALSEVVTIFGTFVGVFIFKIFKADDYTASVIGGSVGNYLSGALSYVIFYGFLTAGSKFYPFKSALRDGILVVKDCFPASIALYISEAPIITGLLAIGFSRNLAVGLSLMIGITIFTGVAKHSARSILTYTHRASLDISQ